LKKFIWGLCGLIVLGIASLYLGGGYLESEFTGGDSAHALAQIDYFYHYWPQKTLWYPWQGTGMSLYSRNYGAFWSAAMTARIFDWTPAQAMHFWQWLTMYLTSLGIMGLGFLTLGPLVGILGGLFFLLSHLSWIWEARIGLFSFATSFFLAPLFFIFFHQALNTPPEKHFRMRLLLIFAAGVLALSIWFHLVVTAVIIEAAFFYALFFFSRQKNIARRFLVWMKTVFLSLLFSSFSLLPYLFYNKQFTSGEINYFDTTSIPSVPWRVFLGLRGFTNQMHDIWFGFFALPVLIFAGAGIILGFWRKNKLAILFLFLSLVFFLQTIVNQFAPSLIQISFKFFSVINTRAILIAMIFLPLVAGFGAVSVSELLLFKLKDSRLKSILVLAITLTIVILLIWRLDFLPSGYKGRCGSSYGPEETFVYFDCSGRPEEILLTRLKAIGSPTKKTIGFLESVLKLTPFIPDSDNLRIDITNIRGVYPQGWSLASSIPILRSSYYMNVLPLKFWNYQDDVFYHAKGNQGEVGQIANWFGLDYLVLDGIYDPIAKFNDWPLSGNLDDLQVRQSPHPVGLATHSFRPTILFFGDQKQNAYFNWWRLLIDGGLDYQKAFIIDGGRRIEALTKGELSQFNLLFLWGEEYKNPLQSNHLIKDYLEAGGKILIDTGWQYTSPWWQKEDLPEWLPIISTHWRTFSNWQLTSENSDLAQLVNSWQPPHYNLQPWGASVVQPEKLRSQAKALLVDQSTGEILAAQMPVGKGEVIWTGLNFVGMHQMEDKKVTHLTRFLLQNLVIEESNDFPVEVKRLGPEKIEIQLTNQSGPTWLYWREAYFPTWKAKLNSDEAVQNIYRGGPELMLLRLPSGTTEVTLFHNFPWVFILGNIITFLSGLGALIFLIHGYRVERRPPKTKVIEDEE